MRRFPQPDPETVEIIAVHCYGCGRKLGVTHEEKSYVHCDELCWHKEQLDSLENAARDRFICFMAEQGMSHSQIANVFGLHRTRAQQILATSNEVDYLQAGRRK
jgi:hypothetical protein